MKKNTESQTYSDHDREVQTMADEYTELPMSQFYFYGLRGLHCGIPPHIVELTTENAFDLDCLSKTKPVAEDAENDTAAVTTARLPSSTSGQRRCRKDSVYGNREIEEWAAYPSSSITQAKDTAKSFPDMALLQEDSPVDE